MNRLAKTTLWRWLRERKILMQHRRVATICEKLIEEYRQYPVSFSFVPKIQFDTDRIIWQYWAQGYTDVPEIVKNCLESVERYADGYKIVRLTDKTLSDYLDFPEFLLAKRAQMTTAHFSDLLRLMLLKTYGGIWMDATLMLTRSIPDEYAQCDFFVFRRDPLDPDYRYWRNVYAYYFGWAKGFRVNMLNSFIVAKKENRITSELCDLLLSWWKQNDGLPDYFFFQILFDVYYDMNSIDFLFASDTPPHYLQQFRNDPHFHLMDIEMIKKKIPIHKLTHKIGK